jgi:hypothetical protein
MQKAINSQSNKEELYVVGSASNIYEYDSLLDFRDVNNVDFPLAIADELGYRYMKDFNSVFTFIGKNNHIIATLTSTATLAEMDITIKRAMASFYDIYLKTESSFIFLAENQAVIELSEYFHIENFENMEFYVSDITNPAVLNYWISGGKLYITRTDSKGFTDMKLNAKIKNRDIFLQTELQVINPTEKYEDFEIATLADSQFNWISTGSQEWFVTDEESFFNEKSLRSGNIQQSQISGAGLDLTLEEPGIVMFAYKTSSRPYYNKLNFYIDGTLMAGSESPYLWSGENDWRIVSYSVRGGTRKLVWEYSKSPYDPLFNRDRVWIDLVVIPDKLAPGTKYNSGPTTELTAYPNPFNPSTRISFSLDKPETAQLMIFDIKGRQVAEVFKGDIEKGFHSFEFDGSGLSSGMYYSVLKYGEKVLTNRIILAK